MNIGRRGAAARVINKRTASAIVVAAAALFAGAAQAKTAWVSTETKAYVLDTNATRAGAEPDSTPVHIAVGLKLQNRAALDEHMRHITTFGDREFGVAISREQFADSYAPSPRRAQDVADYLSRAGFTNVVIAPNRLLITADGTVGGARSAFNTEFAHYQLADGRSAFANSTDARVPKNLSDVVNAVVGLQNADQMHTQYQLAPRVTRLGGVRTNAATHGYNPTSFGTVYGATGTPTGSAYAAGIISEGDMTQTLLDLQGFAAVNSLTPTDTEVVVPNGGAPGTDTSGQLEWDLDSQTIVGTSGGVKKLYFYAAPTFSYTDLEAAFNQAVVDNVTKAINVSLGTCESSSSSAGFMSTSDAIFTEAVAQGQTFFVSSGDGGAHTGCYLHHGIAVAVSYPASSPYVVAVGGTTLITDSNNNYVSESAWIDGGGGISSYELAPAWQNPYLTGQGRTLYRGVPDIAADADPYSGAVLIVNYNPSTQAYVTEQVGGTSLSAPLSTGAWTRVWSYFGDPTYFFAPYIYAFVPEYPTAWGHDVTSGCNGKNTSRSYCATTGWDYTTGFGSWNIHGDIFGY